MVSLMRLCAMLVAALLAGAVLAPAASADPKRPSALEQLALDALRDSGFADVVDGDKTFPYPQIAATPNIDVAIIRLDRKGRPREAANALLSRDYPNGVLAPIGRDLRADGVRYRAWDLARFDETGGKTWTSPLFTAADDVVAGRERAPIEFMEPYPASTFKLLIAYWTAHLVDRGLLGWDQRYAYDPGQNPPSLCAGARTATIAEFLDTMISESNNRDTCALIKRLHELRQIDPMNEGFVRLGLPSLQVLGTDPATGGNWQVGQITMGAIDTAKLLLIVEGGRGTLFRRADGSRVTRAALSDSSRAVVARALADQGFNEVLSTTNWCGHRLPGASVDAPEYPTRGIPTATPARWLDENTGFATVDGIPYFQDTRPCNAAAEVQFAHKTGLTRNYGSDAGIVHALPGRPRRDYVIAVFTNLGNRYTDPVLNSLGSDQQQGDCWTADFICYSEAFARFGKAIDSGMARLQDRGRDDEDDD